MRLPPLCADWTCCHLHRNIAPVQDAGNRDQWLTADDDALLADCAVDTYRAGGPGGQKRNKTSSAVRLRHRPTGLAVIAEESRSQHENKARAVKRLRMAIALHVRVSVAKTWSPPEELQRHLTPAGRIEISPRHAAYAVVAASLLDVVAARHGRLGEAAEVLGVRTAQLSRFLASDGKVRAAVNQIRARTGLRPIEGTR
jgi:hypothetical protein